VDSIVFVVILIFVFLSTIYTMNKSCIKCAWTVVAIVLRTRRVCLQPQSVGDVMHDDGFGGGVPQQRVQGGGGYPPQAAAGHVAMPGPRNQGFGNLLLVCMVFAFILGATNLNLTRTALDCDPI